MITPERARELRDYRFRTAADLAAAHGPDALGNARDDMLRLEGACESRLEELDRRLGASRPTWLSRALGLGGAAAAIAGTVGLGAGITGALAVIGAIGTGVGLPIGLYGLKQMDDEIRSKARIKQEVDVLTVEQGQLRAAMARLSEARLLQAQR